MLAQITRTFGTEDSEWYCATQAILNTLFGLKSRVAHEQAKAFIDSILKSFCHAGNEEHEGLIEGEERPLELREDLSEDHYSQLFFVVGHVAIKMLAYAEFLEAEVKNILTEGNKSKRKSESNPDQRNEDGKEAEEDDLAQITGGREAEIDQYTTMLRDITE